MKFQKVFLWLLFLWHAFMMFACCKDYYDNIINKCSSWGPLGKCPWGAESMGLAWINPEINTYFLIASFVESMVVFLCGLYFIKHKQYNMAGFILLLPVIIGFFVTVFQMIITY